MRVNIALLGLALLGGCLREDGPTSLPSPPCVPGPLSNGTHVISGYVYEQRAGAAIPIGSAAIEVTELDPDIGATIATASSGADGSFVITSLPATVWVIASKNGYQSSRWSEIRLSSDTMTINFELVR